MLFRIIALCAAALVCAKAQDERRAVSPDGRIEFRIRIAPQEPGYLWRLAYDVSVAGKPVLERSYIGIELLYQEPLLGEKPGLISSQAGSGPGYHSIVANFIQEGSVGRMIDIEARVHNDGVAFRWIIPETSATENLAIADEAVEFRFAAGASALKGLPHAELLQLPLKVDSIEIAEIRPPNFPPVSLTRLDAATLVTRLAKLPKDPEVAYHGHSPYVGPWRVILLSPDRSWPKTLPLQ